MAIDTNKNSYSFLFAGIMIILVTVILSATSISLKERQKENMDKEKKQSILYTIGIKTDRDKSGDLFDKYIKEQIVLDISGKKKEGNAFLVNLATEIKKTKVEQQLPIYIAQKDNEKFYILPLRGQGLWGDIWGYICLGEDINTVKGVYFDHKSETPGLGAEISGEIFQNQFLGKKIFDENNNFKSIKVQKGGIKILPKEEQKYAVDAISGGTITGDAVADMLKHRLDLYLPYLKRIKQEILDEKLKEEKLILKDSINNELL